MSPLDFFLMLYNIARRFRRVFRLLLFISFKIRRKNICHFFCLVNIPIIFIS